MIVPNMAEKLMGQLGPKFFRLLAMQKASRSHCDGPTLRAWTYVLLSSSLFLRKAEAAALTIGDFGSCLRASLT